MAYQNSQATFLGRMRFWRSSDDAYVAIADGGTLKTGLTLGNSGSSAVNVVIIAPSGSTVTYDGAGEPGDIWVEGSQAGLYRLRLYGSGSSGANALPLEQIGRYAFHIMPMGTTAFDALSGYYDVSADWDLRFASTLARGSGGEERLRASLTIFRWYTHEILSPSDAGLTAVTINILDRQANVLASLTLADATIATNTLWFDKAISGLLGGDVLVANVQITYKGTTHQQYFPLVSRFGA